MSVEVKTTPFDLEASVRQIVLATREAAILAVTKMNRILAQEIKGGLRKGTTGVAPLSPWTIYMRRRGKLGGVWPVRARVIPTRPLVATGTTVDNIQAVQRFRGAAGAESAVIIAPVPHPWSGSFVSRLAPLHEGGFNVRFRVTPRMRRFFFAVLGKGKAGAPAGKGYLKGSGTTIRVIPRPAWQNVATLTFPKLVDVLAPEMSKQIAATGLAMKPVVITKKGT